MARARSDFAWARRCPLSSLCSITSDLALLLSWHGGGTVSFINSGKTFPESLNADRERERERKAGAVGKRLYRCVFEHARFRGRSIFSRFFKAKVLLKRSRNYLAEIVNVYGRVLTIAVLRHLFYDAVRSRCLYPETYFRRISPPRFHVQDVSEIATFFFFFEIKIANVKIKS